MKVCAVQALMPTDLTNRYSPAYTVQSAGKVAEASHLREDLMHLGIGDAVGVLVHCIANEHCMATRTLA